MRIWALEMGLEIPGYRALIPTLLSEPKVAGIPPASFFF